MVWSPPPGGRGAGLGDVVSVDMGGTSYDVCLIREVVPRSRSTGTGSTATASAFPMVDIHAIGAGGGSLIRAAGRRPHRRAGVGGEQPGPVCYGRGGTEPTVTDADLVLGRLDPSSFWGGGLELDIEAARPPLNGSASGSE